MMMVFMPFSRAFRSDGHNQCCIGIVLLANTFIGIIRLMGGFDFPQTFNQRNHIDDAVFIRFP